MKNKIRAFYRLALILVCFISIILHFNINDEIYNIHEFSFFTVWSNIFCFTMMCIIFIKHLLKKDINSQWLMFFKGMSTASIICTFLVYHFAEAVNKYDFMSIGVFGIPLSDLSAHYLVPFMYVFDWLLFQPKGYFKWRYAFYWMAFPLAYFFSFLTRCICNSPKAFVNVKKYPYFFMDYETLGTPMFLHYLSLLAIVFLSVNIIVIFLDKYLYRRKQT